MRDKAVAIVRRRAEDAVAAIVLSVTHVVLRVRWFLASPLSLVTSSLRLRSAVRRGAVKAQVVTFDGAAPTEVSVRARSWRGIDVTPAQTVSGPALLCVRAGRRPLRWRLVPRARR
jgi:hypothetical protein